MLVLSRDDVEALLDPRELVDALAAAMADLSAGGVSMPNRVAALVPERQGLLGVMPGYVPSLGALTAKLVSIFPQNAGGSLPTHQALIAAFDPETSALSTRLLAREDARVLAIVGTGVQARSHARTVPLVRDFSEVRVAGRSAEKAELLAAELREQGLPAVGTSSYEEAMRGADVVCATTHSREPVVRREWLDDGTHVTSVGYDPDGRELDDATVVDALVVVESRTAALAPPPAGSNDLTQPIAAGLITADHIHAEIGELVAGTQPGRTSPEQITLYKSVGVAVQDAAATALVLARAEAAGAGTRIRV